MSNEEDLSNGGKDEWEREMLYEIARE